MIYADYVVAGILTLLIGLHLYLRGRKIAGDIESETKDGVTIEDLIENLDNRPWYVDKYWASRRFMSHYLDPREWYYEIKWFIQRGQRGWANRDLWSLDSYLADWLPDALRRLKKIKHGIPGDMFDHPEDISEEDMKQAEIKWDGILDSMITGFEAWHRMEELTYENELGEYPLRRPAGITKEAWKIVQDERFQKQEVLRERDQKIFEEGMKNFAKHFGSLWD